MCRCIIDHHHTRCPWYDVKLIRCCPGHDGQIVIIVVVIIIIIIIVIIIITFIYRIILSKLSRTNRRR